MVLFCTVLYPRIITVNEIELDWNKTEVLKFDVVKYKNAKKKKFN